MGRTLSFSRALFATLLGVLSLSCMQTRDSEPASTLSMLARSCIDAHLRAGWLECSYFEREKVLFSLSTHPNVPFWNVYFRDYAVLHVDGREPGYGCNSAKDTLEPARIWFSEGGPPYAVRKTAEVGWDPESYSEEQWEEFLLGPEVVQFDGVSLGDLGLATICSGASPVD